MSNAGKSILVVDDEPNVRLMLRSTLEADGFSVTEACDGEEAIQSVEQLKPALVLLDLWMHRGDGMQVLEYLNRKAPEDHPRVIVLTAHGRVPVVVKAMRLGASDFLEKPTTPEDLRLSVSAALEDAPESNPLPVEQTPSRPAAKLGPVLASIRSAVWNQDIRLTERVLTALFRKAWSDPAYFNLLGAVFEAEGNRRRGQDLLPEIRRLPRRVRSGQTEFAAIKRIECRPRKSRRRSARRAGRIFQNDLRRAP